MNKEIKAEWVKALNSGEYEQGSGYLRANDSFCCLGVLCEVFRGEHPNKIEVELGCSGVYTYNSRENYPPDDVVEWAELNSDNPIITLDADDLTELKGRVDKDKPAYFLSDLNDFGIPFKTIAKLIDKHL